MKYMELIAPCHFGMEAVLKREILDLGYEISKVEDGKVTFLADAEGIAQANMFLRTTERILLKTGEFKAVTFDELFEKTKAIPWEEYIPKDGKFWVAKANSVKSALFSPSDIQSIMKKAIVERLKGVYNVSWFPEDGASFPIRVAFMKDVATIGIDTSGVSLHKRGYRQMTVKAPITETLASALIMLTPWKKDRSLVDPFCGSGTFPIEAAMMAADIAPGMNRSFLAEDWKQVVPRRCWYEAVEEAQDRVNLKIETDIQGYKIGGKSGTAEIRATRDIEDDYVSSYCCFAPADDPELIMLIQADYPDPSIGYYGSQVVTPYARDIMEEILPYMGFYPEYSSEDYDTMNVSVPLLTNSDTESAKATLDQLGLTYEIVGSGTSVLSQSPTTGTNMAKGGKLSLIHI